MKYFGFVYIWYDTKNKKYIIGSHHGETDDGYNTTTGGEYVKNIFNSRPDTMKRKILEYNTQVDDYRYTQQLEQKWLDMRPDIAINERYYNMKQFATGGIDKSVKRTKPVTWRIWKSKHNNMRVQQGIHNFTSETARVNANKRIKNGTHHFLISNFNKKGFTLIKNGTIIGTYESKVAACKVYPAHLIDKLRRDGEWKALKDPTLRYKGLWIKGDHFSYEPV